MKIQTLKEIEIAKFLHENYEECAKITGWETQQNTRVPFEELPEKNKRTMLMVAGRLKELLLRQKAIEWIKHHRLPPFGTFAEFFNITKEDLK